MLAGAVLSNPANRRPMTWERLINLAAARYWQQRPDVTEQSGTNIGYRLHARRHQTPCQPCREAHALVKRVTRLRIDGSHDRERCCRG